MTAAATPLILTIGLTIMAWAIIDTWRRYGAIAWSNFNG